MPPSIGLVANVYNEANALPGWIETHLPAFDDVRVYHTGPRGEYSNDGTMDILRKWNIPVKFGDIDQGFGVVRTEAIRWSPCDYVMILDADERFRPVHCRLSCEGESTPQSEVDAILQTYDFRDVRTVLPNWENVARLGANLFVRVCEPYDAMFELRCLLALHNPDCVITVRRHWHDMSLKRPTQNWYTDPDWQMRIVRNHPSIYYDPARRMHENLVGATVVYRANMERGPFFDHHHLFFKKMEVEQRAHDVAIYDRIHKGESPPTFEEFNQ